MTPQPPPAPVPREARQGGPWPRDPELAQAVAELREIAHGAPWRPVRDRCRLQEGRAWIKQAAADLADAIDGDADPHDVIAAFDRFTASIWDATHKRRRSLNDPGEPGAHPSPS